VANNGNNERPKRRTFKEELELARIKAAAKQEKKRLLREGKSPMKPQPETWKQMRIRSKAEVDRQMQESKLRKEQSRLAKTAGAFEDDEIVSYGKFIRSGGESPRELMASIKENKLELTRYAEVQQEMQTLIPGYRQQIASAIGTKNSMFVVPGCQLIEVRKGARITERKSSYARSSSGGSLGIGRLRVGGSSGGGSGKSTSISYPAPDVLATVDGGNFYLFEKSISFGGSKFTRSSDFTKLIDFDIQGRQIMFSPAVGSKVWIVEFSSIATLLLVSSVLDLVWDSPSRELPGPESLIKKIDAQWNNFLDEMRRLASGKSELIQESIDRYLHLQESYPRKYGLNREDLSSL
jgi:hypothetical protein